MRHMGTGTYMGPIASKIGKLIALDKSMPMLFTPCRYLDKLGSYGVSKIFVGQALETGNGNGFDCLLVFSIGDDAF
jgi:hypothetical protein